MKIDFSIRRLLKILLLAALLACGAWVVKGPPGEADGASRIVVTEAVVAHQRARWLKQWGRPPTEQELRKAVDLFVRGEVFYRAALAAGMDRADPRVRLALIQKVEMLAAGRADAQALSDEDLAAFFALRKERYSIPAQLSLLQVLFKEREGAGQAAAQELLVRFSKENPADAAVREAGDASLLERIYRNTTAPDMARQFGQPFVTALKALPTGEWAGPIRSSYGWHVVKVEAWEPARIPELAQVRERVPTDLRYESRQAAEEQGYLEIASKYQVSITDGAEALFGAKQP
jgi:hypothetical protein